MIAILGALAVIGLVALNRAREKGRDAQRRQDLGTLRTALQTYYDDSGFVYPDTLDAGGAPDQSSLGQGIFDPDEAINPLVNEFLSKVSEPPNDDANYQYWYDANDSQEEYILYTHLEGSQNSWYWIGSAGNGTEPDASTHDPANCEADATCAW